MNQKQMQYFVTVYETQNIQVAADQLFVTRQGVSKVIRLLETELGQALFTRSSKGVTPTDYAVALLPHARQFLEACTAISGLHTLAAQSHSVVTVYAIDHILAFLGADFVIQFHQKYPQIILNVVDTTDDAALSALSAQQCNFAIVTGPFEQTQFQADPLFYSRYSVIMNQQHPLANKRHITFTDLDGQTIVSKGRAYSCFRNMIDKYVLGLNRKIHILVETTDESVIRDLLIKNKAIYLGYDYMNTLWSHPEVISRPLVDSGHEGNTIYLLSNSQLRMTKVNRYFREFLLAWIAS